VTAKQSLLEQIATDILQQNVCPDLAQQATQLVMGNGTLDSDMMFIGEAPGKKEDLSGLPFVGAAGKFLNVMLFAAGLERKDVYITNIVKYRPPNNRDPLPEEKAAFLPYLLRQIQIINPKIVITLGRHSMEYFLPGMKIGEIHGQPQLVVVQGQAMIIMPLYHPAAALYNGGLRQTLLDDFLKVPLIIASAQTLPDHV
jgi:uracil-DNA glycosylase family 4